MSIAHALELDRLSANPRIGHVFDVVAPVLIEVAEFRPARPVRASWRWRHARPQCGTSVTRLPGVIGRRYGARAGGRDLKHIAGGAARAVASWVGIIGQFDPECVSEIEWQCGGGSSLAEPSGMVVHGALPMGVIAAVSLQV